MIAIIEQADSSSDKGTIEDTRMTKRSIEALDLWKMSRVGSPVLGADSEEVFFCQTHYDLDANKGRSSIWSLDAAANNEGSAKAEPRRLSSSEFDSSQPTIRPDGGEMIFVRRKEKSGPGADSEKQSKSRKKSLAKYAHRPQLYRMSLEGGEAERLTDLPLGVASPRYLPDGKRVIFLAGLYDSALDLASTAELDEAREEDPVKAHVTEDRVYRHWDRWLTEGKIHHLFLLDLESGDLSDLTPDWDRWMGLFSNEGVFDISPDGRELSFQACRSEKPHSPLLFGVYRLAIPDADASRSPGSGSADGDRSLPATAAQPELLHPDHDGPASRPIYSPDGQYIVYGIQRIMGFYADRTRLVAYDRSSGQNHTLSEDWDGSAGAWTFGSDSETIYFLAQTGAQTGVYSLNLPAAITAPADNPPQLLLRSGTINGLSAQAGALYFVHQDIRRPAELHLFDLSSSRLERITDCNSALVDALDLAEPEEIFFEGAAGDQVQMYLVRPPASAPDLGRPRPLVHLIHGGPHGVFGDAWHWRWNAQIFAAAGYNVAMVNFHGSTGFGEDYTMSILGEWGAKPAADILAATDHLIAMGEADPERMAITGGSYGGYLVSYLAGETDRFACIVNHAGVCDFQTQFASDITQGRRRSMGGELWSDLEGLDRYNPIRRAENFKTPMLVIHGVKDYRVPYNQGLQIYNVYKAMDLPSRLVVYPDENHWILKPANSVHWYAEFLDWLERWMGPNPGLA